MNTKLEKYLETALLAEERAINFFSGLSRKFYKISDLKNGFENYAKSKIISKQFMLEILRSYKNNSLKLNNYSIDYDLKMLINALEDAEVVGEYSMPEEVLKIGFNYLKETTKLFNYLKNPISGFSEFDEIISNNKNMLDVIKKHIHNYTEDFRFYGYE